ncbi:cobalamin B12-binding domain-containing protein [Desulfolucanica intricata]|uniref:cobalamin B12-binding domain-containing protein n=1 Tax=Desulfolucanica intricata TaxID=1285191 RepID=UPI00082C46A4|nr:cobalamin-dependent protein [Desulfolucanica intricata]
MKNDLINAIAELEEDKALALVREKIKSGETPLEIVEQCKLGVEIVGKRYSEEIYYLSDLIMSEEILRGVMEILEPYFPQNDNQSGTKVIMGTIEGDIHDLGKNILVNLLRSNGFKVYDLGVDVQPEDFVKSIIETGACILGISVLITYSINEIKKLIKLIEEAGLRNKVTVVIGGYPVNDRIRDYTGADYYEKDAIKAVELFKKIAAEKTKPGSVVD